MSRLTGNADARRLFALGRLLDGLRRRSRSRSATDDGALLGRGLEPLEARQLLAGYVIEISVDGLRPDAVTQLGQSQVPNFYRLMNEGSSTLNARADYDYTETSPNHTDIQTARPVLGTYGHGVSINSDDGTTVHAKAGSYVTSVWDIVHDNGLRTGFYASKDKFAFFDRSWNATNGRVDPIGVDNGQDKIDTYVFNATTSALNSTFLSDQAADPYNYSLIHYADPDVVGHASGWMSTNYLNAVKTVDGYLGTIFNMVDTNGTFTGNTDIILVADHGGSGTGHGDATLATSYTVPFMVWGPDASAGGDLYAMNPTTRANPGTGRPNNTANPQPIRNGDGANLATDLLGLGVIDGSLFNNQHNLVVMGSTLPVVSISATVGTANEETLAAGQFQVTRTGSTSSALTVNYTVGGTATNGTDYQTLTGQVIVPIGAASQVFSVTPINDTLGEGTETCIATLSSDPTYTVGTAAATVNVIDGLAPTAPTSLTGTALSGLQIRLNWVDNSNNELNFLIERSTNGTSFTQVGSVAANVTTFTNTGLSANTWYWYRVRAYRVIDGVNVYSSYTNVLQIKTKRK
ncbi:MAG: alkaline phosphatase family protein [Planctomycetota bacterium]|nr:alkaline phosphatase family protein [Planctomycetota bacterium]